MSAPKPEPQLPRPPIFMLIFMSLFGFIGLTLLIFLWFGTERDFPPIFFKVIASFIAIGFMTLGFGTPLAALKARNRGNTEEFTNPTQTPSASGYKCPNCGAGLGQQEVSPSGDVKCSYCLKWWNVHRSGQ